MKSKYLTESFEEADIHFFLFLFPPFLSSLPPLSFPSCSLNKQKFNLLPYFWTRIQVECSQGKTNVSYLFVHLFIIIFCVCFFQFDFPRFELDEEFWQLVKNDTRIATTQNIRKHFTIYGGCEQFSERFRNHSIPDFTMVMLERNETNAIVAPYLSFYFLLSSLAHSLHFLFFLLL